VTGVAHGDGLIIDVIVDQKFIIEQLEHCIHGDRRPANTHSREST
jgi:hypothetical protein